MANLLKVGKIIHMKKIILLFTVISTIQISAQQRFINAGKIEFEMKKNQHKQLDDEGNSESEWIKELKKNMPKFVTETYSLSFNENKSVYKLEKENTDNKYLWGGKPSETDIVLQDLKANRISFQRDVYEKTYLIQDSSRVLDWRITDETRDIAGFECRKAVTKICDSVYVVAFYTDQIPVSAGPESFGGLPGMILGLAVPRLSMTWFATKLELAEPTSQQLSPTQKGKKSDWKGIETDMKKALKDWGKYGDQQMWRLLL
jgi:GLPGLI family protein